MPSTVAVKQPIAIQQAPPSVDLYDFLDRTDASEHVTRPLVQANPGTGELHGFHYDMPFEEYAAVDALNGSKLLNMRRSPMAYKHLCDNPKPESPAMVLGTLIHRLVLEPNTDSKIVVFKPVEGMTRRFGKMWDQFREQNAGMTIITETEYADVVNTATAVLQQEPIRKYAHAEGPTEVSMFWRHPISGRRMKARIDKLIPATHTIFDLKKTRDCRSFKVGSQSYHLGYHMKMAHYAHGYELLTGHKPLVRLGAIESVAPYESATYRVTEDVLAQGWDEIEHLLGRLEACEAKNEWPAEHEEETDLLLPAWTQFQELDQYQDN